jgi:hypothetical protein
VATFLGNLPVIGRFAANSPVQELEYYLDKGGWATLVQPATGLFDGSRQQESRENRKVRAKKKKSGRESTEMPRRAFTAEVTPAQLAN